MVTIEWRERAVKGVPKFEKGKAPGQWYQYKVMSKRDAASFMADYGNLTAGRTMFEYRIRGC